MNLLPQASGNRPLLAVEILLGGVVAGRSPEAGLPLAAVARAALPAHAVVPSLRPGNIADRVAVVAAMRRVLEQVGARSNGRRADLTLVIPDAAVRVLLLDFDTLPGKLSEALPIVRFRLKKLVPFDPDSAMVSFQVMSHSRSMVRVLAVAIPRDVLSEYESAAREAGFEPGAVLPSTLAALAAVTEGEGASLIINAHAEGVTTAIVRAGIVLLHRAIELAEFAAPVPGGISPALLERSASLPGEDLFILSDREAGEDERLAQQLSSEYGRNSYTDRIATEQVTQDQDAATQLEMPPFVVAGVTQIEGVRASAGREYGAQGIDMYAAEAAPVARSPYASPDLQQQLDAQFHNAAYVAPGATDSLGPFPTSDAGSFGHSTESGLPLTEQDNEREPLTHTLSPDLQAEEIARAVSVAVAYFEDSLGAVPEVLLSAGPLGAEALNRTLREQGIAAEDGVRVRELVGAEALAPSATSTQVPRGWLAGVTGALRS